jgi:hypothetical protein
VLFGPAKPLREGLRSCRIFLGGVYGVLKAWYGLRRRRGNELVIVSIPWSGRRVSSTPLSTSDVSRIVAKRALEAGLGKANGMALVRAT